MSLQHMGRTSAQPSVLSGSGGSGFGGGSGGGVNLSSLGGGGTGSGIGTAGRTRFDMSYDPVEASLLTTTAATTLWTSIVVPSLWQGRLSEGKMMALMQFVFTQVNVLTCRANPST